MASKKKTNTRKPARQFTNRPAIRSMTPKQTAHMPLRAHTAAALESYFAHLDGDKPARLYDLVLREVEEPLFRAVMAYVEGNQSRAAEVLGLNRGTLRKKLREHGLVATE